MFVQSKMRNDHIHCHHADAFSELEVCQNAFAAGAVPQTPLEELTLY